MHDKTNNMSESGFELLDQSEISIEHQHTASDVHLQNLIHERNFFSNENEFKPH